MSYKPAIIGEQNPYNSPPCFDLYPLPKGCAGHRLATKVLGMKIGMYLELFDRFNLCRGPYNAMEAAHAATYLASRGRQCILLGRKVCSAFGANYAPFTVRKAVKCGGVNVLVLPHPSGRCRAWNDPESFELARLAIGRFIPELVPHLSGQQ